MENKQRPPISSTPARSISSIANLLLTVMCAQLVTMTSGVMTFQINGGGSLLINAEDYKQFSISGYQSTCRQIQVIFPAYSGIKLSSSFECRTFDTELFKDATGVTNLGCTSGTTAAGLVTFTVANFDPSASPSTTSAPFIAYRVINSNVSQSVDSSNADGGIVAKCLTSAGVEIESVTSTNPIVFGQFVDTAASTIELAVEPATNGEIAMLSITYTNLAHELPIEGSLQIKVPNSNVMYETVGDNSRNGMFKVTPTPSVATAQGYSGANLTGTAIAMGSVTLAYTDERNVVVYMKNTAVVPAGGSLKVTAGQVQNPHSTAPMTGFELITGDKNKHHSIFTDVPTLQTTTAATATGTVTMTPGQDGILQQNVKYSFSVTMKNDVPIGGYMTLTIPSAIGVPATPSWECTSCNGLTATIEWDSATRILKFPIFTSYTYANQRLDFWISGLTNPGTTSAAVMTWGTYAIIPLAAGGTADYPVDTLTGLSVTATLGELSFTDLYPTDNSLIYGRPTNYTMTFNTNHDIKTDYNIKLTFPADYYIKENLACQIGTWDEDRKEPVKWTSTCVTNKVDRTITFGNFLTADWPKLKALNMTVDSIVNPGTLLDTGEILLQTINAVSSGVVDSGSFSIKDEYFKASNITEFYVIPKDTGVGQYPATYNFKFRPNGEVLANSYIVLTMPKEMEIISKRGLERKCGDKIVNFTYSSLHCNLSGNKIIIVNGWRNKGSDYMFDDGDLVPAMYEFEIKWFRNPRSLRATGAWGIQIFTKQDVSRYTWDFTTVPTVRMTTAAKPQKMTFQRGTRQNGALTFYQFNVQTTNYLKEGDKITIEMPVPIFMTKTSLCLGVSNNLAKYLPCKVSTNLSKIVMTLLMPSANSNQGRRLQKVDQLRIRPDQRIDSGNELTFQITDVKNGPSFRPSDSIKYEVQQADGAIIESRYDKNEIINLIPGDFSEKTSGVVPSNFKQGAPANYTIEIQPQNYEQNMDIIVTLPKEISFTGDDLTCIGIKGVDNPNQVVCKIDTKAKTITITKAVTFQRGNPGEISIQMNSLRNPDKNIVTTSFKIDTFTSDGFRLDKISADVVINFFCEYPCRECDQETPQVCKSCYPAAPERIFFQNKCLSECPASKSTDENELIKIGMVKTKDNQCVDCKSPCKDCIDTVSTCTGCLEGYSHIKASFSCRERVIWPFPYIICAFFAFLLSAISECVTKSESRFKESFLALLSIPEILSWANLIVFLIYRVGMKSGTALAILATGIYVIINLVHACVHSRKMVPRSLISYKTLVNEYKCSTWFFRLMSYIFSFKFSLILVSYFFLRPRFKGDYSVVNWKQYNRFALSFFLPYLFMMGACAVFLVEDGFYSYPGFVAVEVCTISTTMAVMGMLDALSSIKCKTVGKAAQIRQVKVASGADYESDEDIDGKKQVSRRNRVKSVREKNKDEEFGEQEDESEEESIKSVSDNKKLLPSDGNEFNHILDNVNSQNMDTETKHQIDILTQLAEQMRVEKQQLRLDKERIERERERMQEEKESHMGKMDQYMSEYNNQTANLANQVKELGNQKEDLIKSANQKIEEGFTSAQKLLMGRENAGKAYKDVEAEMEDYEPVEEDPNDTEPAEIREGPPIPKNPAYGELDYQRQVEGEEQFFMQQVTPRQGGDSIYGQHDRDDESQRYQVNDQTAMYSVGQVPPSRGTAQDYIMATDGAFSQMTNMNRNAEKSEAYYKATEPVRQSRNSVAHPEINAETEYFAPEKAVYEECSERRLDTDEHEYIQKEPAEYGRIASPHTVHGNEQTFFVQEDAAAGEADGKKNVLQTSDQHFFKREQAAYGENEDAGRRERQATPQHFMHPGTPNGGDMSDRNRSMNGVSETFLNKEAPHFDKSLPQEEYNASEQMFLEQSSPQKGMVSDANRSRIDEGERFFKPTTPKHDKVSNNDRSMAGDNQIQMNKEDAAFQKQSETQSKSGSQQQFFKNDEAARGDVSENPSKNEKEIFVDKSGAAFSLNKSNFEKNKAGTGQKYVNKSGLGDEVNQGLATDGPQIDTQSVDYFDRSEAEFGRPSTKGQKNATQQNFFDAEVPMAGKGDNYNREANFEQEYNPAPEEDAGSGRSASTEGAIANHNPFNVRADTVEQQRENKNELKQAPQAEIVKGGKAKKTIIYSDKSESSVDEMMADTPSNYNIPNGRLDGKSLGLKAILMHAKKMGGGPGEQQEAGANRTIEVPTGNNLSSIPEGTRTPNAAMLNSQRMNANQMNARMGGMSVGNNQIDRSQEGGWGNINQNRQGGAHVIDEQSSGRENTSGGPVPGQSRKKNKKVPATNKTFAAETGGKNVTPGPGQKQPPRGGSMKRNNYL